MASILFYGEKFKLKISLYFGNFLCWTLYFVKVLGQPAACQRAALLIHSSENARLTGGCQWGEEHQHTQSSQRWVLVNTTAPVRAITASCEVRFPHGGSWRTDRVLPSVLVLGLSPPADFKRSPWTLHCGGREAGMQSIPCCRARSLPEGPKQPAETNFTFVCHLFATRMG